MIQAKNLSFNYPGNQNPTIKGIDFSIAKGEIFGFLGPSGAGKSTTQKIIIGILKNYSGDINIMQKPLKDWKNDYYEHIGVSFEFPNLFTKLTGLENLNYFKSMYSGAAADPIELMDMVGLKPDADKRVSDYSKGMRMRLNFCRAFLNKPEILFFDEPTSGQDPANARRVKDIIMSQKKQGRTVFLTTHNMSVATELCDRVAFIVDGQIKLTDSPREMMVKRGSRTVNVEYRDNGNIISQKFEMEGIGNNNQFINLLKEKNIETIHSEEASLESIFIEVTGQRLTAGGQV